MKRPTLKYCLLTSMLAPTLLVGLSQNVQADEGNSFTVTYNPNLITIIDDPEAPATGPENIEVDSSDETSPQTTSQTPETENHAVDTASQDEQSNEAQAPVQIDRIAGPNRFSNAAAISQTGWETAETVLLANGYKEADALTGAPLAAIYDAPILLTREDRLPEETAAELRRLQTKKVVILGGLKSVQQKVQDELAKSYVVERIGGKNRYHQAALVADEIHRLTGKSSPAYVTNAYAFADALSIAQVAARQKAPIFLTKKDQVDPYIKASQNKITSFTIVGGPVSINSQVENQLKALKPAERISGKNRYMVNQNIINQYKFKNRQHAYLVSGEAYADALAASVLANRYGTPMLLIKNQRHTLNSVGALMLSNGTHSISLIGGERTLTPTTENYFASFLKSFTKPHILKSLDPMPHRRPYIDFNKYPSYLKPGQIIPDPIDPKLLTPSLTLKQATEMQGGIWGDPSIQMDEKGVNIKSYRKNLTSDVDISFKNFDLSIQDLITGNFQSPVNVDQLREFIPYAFVEAFNHNIIFNQEKLNQAFAKLLNAERARQGLKPLAIASNPRLIQANDERTYDLARYGYHHGYNLNTKKYYGPHTTPDGLSVGQYYNQKDLGDWSWASENSALIFAKSVYHLVDVDKIAQEFFTQWKNSPDHYRHMMTSSGNKVFHLSVKAGDFYTQSHPSNITKTLTANFLTFSPKLKDWQG